MFSIERIKLRVIRGAVFGAEPPAPVAALGGQQRFAGLLKRRFGGSVGPSLLSCFDGVSVGLARIPQQFPGGDVFSVPDPHVKVCVDPGSGENPCGGGEGAGGGNRFGRRERAKILIALDARVKLAEKRAPVPWVVFPGIFAVEEKANGERLIARHVFSQMAHAIVKIGCSGFRVHAAVYNTDTIRELVMAK